MNVSRQFIPTYPWWVALHCVCAQGAGSLILQVFLARPLGNRSFVALGEPGKQEVRDSACWAAASAKIMGRWYWSSPWRAEQGHSVAMWTQTEAEWGKLRVHEGDPCTPTSAQHRDPGCSSYSNHGVDLHSRVPDMCLTGSPMGYWLGSAFPAICPFFWLWEGTKA